MTEPITEEQVSIWTAGWTVGRESGRRQAVREAQEFLDQLVDGYLVANGLIGVAAGIRGDFDQWAATRLGDYTAEAKADADAELCSCGHLAARPTSAGLPGDDRGGQGR